MILSKINKTLRTAAVTVAAVIFIAKVMEKKDDRDIQEEEPLNGDNFQEEEFDDIW